MVSVILLAGTIAVIPTSRHITIVSSVVPILTAPLLAFVTSPPENDTNRIPRVVARGMALTWWFWVTYSALWYHHRDIWYSGLSVFVLSFCCVALHAAVWSAQYVSDVKEKVPASVKDNMTFVYAFCFSIVLVFAHKFAVLHTLGATEIVLRAASFMGSCWLDLIAALLFNDNLEDCKLVYFFASKVWVFYVHSLFIPLVTMSWLQTGLRLAKKEEEWDAIESEKSSDAGDDEIVPTAAPPNPSSNKRYMFQTKEEEGIGRQTSYGVARARLVRAWNPKHTSTVPDIHSLNEAAASIGTLGVSSANPFDSL
jgi:hypothetical protein